MVIGGPSYMGNIVGDMKKFVGKYRDILAKIPVAAFAFGVAPADIEKARTILHSILDPPEPVAEALFTGKIDPGKLSFVSVPRADDTPEYRPGQSNRE
jgi:menaquinone-dependent protoporphyrinogen IX oxidase